MSSLDLRTRHSVLGHHARARTLKFCPVSIRVHGLAVGIGSRLRCDPRRLGEEQCQLRVNRILRFVCFRIAMFETVIWSESLENAEAAVDFDDVSCMPPAGIAHQIDGYCTKVLRLSPATHRDSWHDVVDEFVPSE